MPVTQSQIDTYQRDGAALLPALVAAWINTIRREINQKTD